MSRLFQKKEAPLQNKRGLQRKPMRLSNNTMKDFLHSRFGHKQVIFAGQEEWFDLSFEDTKEIQSLSQSIANEGELR
ncbi:hypothetical protein A6S26_05145 [Nostoc sp. ATCC 43529]|nr:hypothetical protein A6S26_05145 [Nostoc sp. ATCC 43529]